MELILQRVHPEDKALVQQTIDRAAQDGKDFDFEHRLLMPDGSVKYVHVVAHALNDLSGMVKFVGAVMDVTETKQAEEALRRSEAYLATACSVLTLTVASRELKDSFNAFIRMIEPVPRNNSKEQAGKRRSSSSITE